MGTELAPEGTVSEGFDTAAQADTNAAVAVRHLTHWRQTSKTGRLSPRTTAMVGTVSEGLRAAESAAKTARSQAERIAGDDTVYPDGRKRMVRETLTAARQEATRQLERAETAIDITRAHLTLDALPEVSKGGEQTARADALMHLDRAKPADRADVLRNLATRQDDVGALAAGNWGRDYLLASGMDERSAGIQHGAAVTEAVAAAAAHGDPDRQAAAKAATDVANLRKAHVAMNLAVHDALDYSPGL